MQKFVHCCSCSDAEINIDFTLVFITHELKSFPGLYRMFTLATKLASLLRIGENALDALRSMKREAEKACFTKIARVYWTDIQTSENRGGNHRVVETTVVSSGDADEDDSDSSNQEENGLQWFLRTQSTICQKQLLERDKKSKNGSLLDLKNTLSATVEKKNQFIVMGSTTFNPAFDPFSLLHLSLFFQIMCIVMNRLAAQCSTLFMNIV